MANTSRVFDGDLGFVRGSNSAAGSRLPPEFYANSMNMVNRGGVLQCRPGYRCTLKLPEGNLQGSFLYTPQEGAPQILFVVDGLLYVSLLPFKTFKLVPAVKFDVYAPFVYFCKAEQAVEFNDDGSLRLIIPRSLIFIQDSRSRCAYWDGASAVHTDEVPLGGLMAWSGSRLWVARGKRLFASDLNNPLGFTEGKYLSTDSREEEVFILPDTITALAELPSLEAPLLLAFTEASTTAFRSNIFVRNDWQNTMGFQKTILPKVGCVAHRSVVVHHGLLWWMSAFGVTSFDTAILSNQSSKFQYKDLEMSSSKAFLYKNLSGACAASFENYLLNSVPYVDLFNRHTWVLDNSVTDFLNEQLPAAWNGYWTGTRPVQWMTGIISGQNRIYHISKDYDGHNRLWECFQDDRRDTGCDITWYMESRGYNAQTAGLKQLRYAEVWLSELLGKTDMKVFWAGANQGRYKSCLMKRVKSDRGSLNAGVKFTASDLLSAFRPQIRTVRTEEIRELAEDELTTCEVEADDRTETEDTAFQFMIFGSGPGAVRAIRVFMDAVMEPDAGKCEEDEVGVKAVRFDGGAAIELPLLNTPTTFYQSSRTVTATNKGYSAVGAGRGHNVISQQAADKVADQAALLKAEEALEKIVPEFVGGDLS